MKRIAIFLAGGLLASVLVAMVLYFYFNHHDSRSKIYHAESAQDRSELKKLVDAGLPLKNAVDSLMKSLGRLPTNQEVLRSDLFPKGYRKEWLRMGNGTRPCWRYSPSNDGSPQYKLYMKLGEDEFIRYESQQNQWMYVDPAASFSVAP